MAFISNQWLKKSPKKNRGNGPVEVEVTASERGGPWAEPKGVIAELSLLQTKGEKRKELYLTQRDIDRILPTLMKLGGDPARLETILDTLTRLDAAALITVLSLVFAKKAGRWPTVRPAS